MKVPEHLECDAHAAEKSCNGQTFSYEISVKRICEEGEADDDPFHVDADLCAKSRADVITAIKTKIKPVTRTRKPKEEADDETR